MSNEDLAALLAALEDLARRNYMLALTGRRDPFMPHITNQEIADRVPQNENLVPATLPVVVALQRSQDWTFTGTGFSLVHPMSEAVAA